MCIFELAKSCSQRTISFLYDSIKFQVSLYRPTLALPWASNLMLNLASHLIFSSPVVFCSFQADARINTVHKDKAIVDDRLYPVQVINLLDWHHHLMKLTKHGKLEVMGLVMCPLCANVTSSTNWGLLNILRQSYDYHMIMPKLRLTYDGCLIY